MDNLTVYYNLFEMSRNLTCKDIFYYNSTFISILVCMFSLTIVVGAIFNIFAIAVVISKKSMHHSVHLYTTNMAISDTMYLLLFQPFNAIKVYQYGCWQFGELFGKIYWSFGYMNSVVSILTLTALTIDKYYAIWKPMRWRINSNWNTKCIILIIWIYAFSIAIPRFIYSKEIRITEKVAFILEIVDKMYYFWIWDMFLVILQLLTIIILNIRMISLVYLRIGNLETMVNGGQTSNTHKRVVKTVMYLTVAFLMCTSPGYIIFIIFRFGKKTELSYFSINLAVFAQYLFVIQAMINPLIYSTATHEYKKSVLWIIEVIQKRLSYRIESQE